MPPTGHRPGPAARTSAGWEKHARNPVLGGRHGTCFDIAVLRERGVYRMWVSWRPRRSIALVESRDGLAWNAPAVVLPPDGIAWADDVNRPTVLRRDDGYHMWFTGQSRGETSAIGYATSRDGRTWTAMGDRPVLVADRPWERVAVMCPHVLWDAQARLFRMWYSGGEQWEPDAIGHATSPDGIRWTRHGDAPVFSPDHGCAWERERVTGCQVERVGDWHVMFYIGFEPVDGQRFGRAQIGIARSRDGITGWQRHRANPIIRAATGTGAWDEDACYKPYAVCTGRRWLLWYNGRRRDIEQIGVAIHEGGDLGFDP